MANSLKTRDQLIAPIVVNGNGGITPQQISDAFYSLANFPTLGTEVGVVDERYPYGDVRRFGAKGDGVTEDTAAINAAMLAAGIGGVVFLPPNATFLVDASYVGSVSNLPPKTGVSVIGSGPTSVIKVKPNLRSATVGIAPFYDNANPLADITYRDFTLDFNGQNNLNTFGTGVSNVNRIGGAGGCTNIVFERINFKNAAGHHFILTGPAASSNNVRIKNCTFAECGTSIAGNQDTDHSSIYLDADNSEVTGNTFTNATADTVATAIETHGSKLHVHDNRVTNYATGTNLGADANSANDLDVHDNVYRNILKGIVLFTTGAFVFTRVKIHDNLIGIREATGGPPPGRGIYATATTMAGSVNGSHLSIQDNEIFSETLAQLTVTTAGIDLLRWDDVLIEGNKIHDLMGEAIKVASEATPRMMTRISILVNDIKDVGLTSTAANKRAISLNSLSSAGQTVNNTSIRNNTLIALAAPSAGTTAVTGIEFGTGWFPDTRIVHNTITGFTTQPIKKGTTDAANVFLVIGEGAFAPVNSNMKASLGSEWTDTTASPFKKYVGADTANDGTASVWTVVSPERISADNGDAAKVLVDGDERYQWWNTILTAARDVNLPAASQANRYRVFHITRGAAATGAFNLNVKDSGGSLIKALTAAGQTAMFVSNGAAYRHVNTGTL